MRTHAHYMPFKGEKKSCGLYEPWKCVPQIWLLGSYLDLLTFSASAEFFLRIVFQVAACVYSTGLLENLGKGEKNQQSVVMHMGNHMLHKIAYVLC